MMQNQISYPDDGRARIQDGLGEVMHTIQQSKKRKRSLPEQNGIEESGSKRGSMSNTINGNGDHVNGSSVDSFSDALNGSSAASNDYTNLSQQLHNASNVHDASSTAAAALAAQLTVPQHSDISFASTGSGTDGERPIDSSFDLSGGDSGQNNHGHGNPYLASYNTAGGTAAQVQAAREASNGGGVKPAVGSDEWHKVRRDNHKEGRSSPLHVLPHDHSLPPFFQHLTLFKSNDAAVKQSTKASTNWPKSSLAAKKTKAPSSKALSLISSNSKPNMKKRSKVVRWRRLSWIKRSRSWAVGTISIRKNYRQRGG